VPTNYIKFQDFFYLQLDNIVNSTNLPAGILTNNIWILTAFKTGIF